MGLLVSTQCRAPQSIRLFGCRESGQQSIHLAPYTIREGFHLITLILIPTPFGEQEMLQLR